MEIVIALEVLELQVLGNELESCSEIFSVGIFWPGTFSLAAVKLPGAGTAMYAFMALAGDVGCSSGPTLVGIVANYFGGDLQRGLVAGILFPVLILAGIYALREKK